MQKIHTNNAPEAVSYTHLDVYKRQPPKHTEVLWRSLTTIIIPYYFCCVKFLYTKGVIFYG